MSIKSRPIACQFRNIFSNLGYVDRKINVLSHFANARSHFGSSRLNSRGIFHQRKEFKNKKAIFSFIFENYEKQL